jgi:hypothetical protein
MVKAAIATKKLKILTSWTGLNGRIFKTTNHSKKK